MFVDRDALRQWSQQHDGYDLTRSAMVRGWLRAMHVTARPITRAGIPPTAVTLAGIGAAAAAVMTARANAPGPLAAGLVLTTAVCDGVDGAVALQRAGRGRRVNRHGGAIDHAADRVTDVLFAAALARAGAPRSHVIAAAAATLSYEGLRSSARRTGRLDGLVTVGERPFRVAVVCAGLVAAPAAGAATIALMTGAAVVQVLRRTGRRPERPQDVVVGCLALRSG